MHETTRQARTRLCLLADAHQEGVDAVGGKAHELAILLQKGFTVPRGFCITTAMFDDFIEMTGIGPQIAELAGTGREGYEAARAIVIAAPIPQSLAKRILESYHAMGSGRVAVRSSALGEDSASHSFAGQHDTMLDVSGDEALLEAVRICWGSLWSDRAHTYRQMEGVQVPMKIGILVQEMVLADGAGVVFTVDPVEGDPDRLVIEACWGLGEGLVAGRVTTDSFVVDTRNRTLLSKQIRYKVMATRPGQTGGVALVKVPQDQRSAPVLTDAQALELADLAIRIRNDEGGERDIEWAIVDGTLHLLQCRPITTKPRKTTQIDPHNGRPDPKIREGILWSRMDIGEIFTGVMTPLGLSLAKYYQYNIHSDCIRALGIYDLGDPNEYMGMMQGHVYLNVSYSAYLLTQCPPTRDQSRFTIRFTSEECDVSQYKNPYGEAISGVDIGDATRFWMRYQFTELATAQSRADRMVESRFAQYDRFQTLNLTEMSRAELDHEMQRALDYFHRMHYGYMPYYINAFGFYGMLTEMSQNWLGSEGASLQNRLKGDMSNLRTVEVAREVWQLAQAAKASPAVWRIIQNELPDATAAALKADPDGLRFWNDIMVPFMRANGIRGRQEMEITQPRWVDDPSYLFQMIRSYVVNDFSIDDVLAQRRGDRATDTNAILAKLPFHRRKIFELVIKMYSVCSELREATRMAMTTSVWLLRCIVYEVGRRLVREGLLRSLDEVAFLDFHDILAYLSGRLTATEAFPRQKIDSTRREHLYNLRMPEPPLTFIGSYDPSKFIRLPAGSDVIQGLGTSPGRIRAKARVIHELVRQVDEFVPGEILVTTFTDASWTPLFAVAAGVVTDIGSMLSHSSIVAREFNIPSVVNTKVATQHIRTGDMLVIDGDQGAVHIERS